MARTTTRIISRTPLRADAPAARRRPVLSLALALSALAVTAVACGDDEADSSVGAPACDAAIDFGAAFAQAPQDPVEIKAFAKERLVPIGELLERNIRGDAASAAATLHAAFVTLSESGDPGALEAPDAAAARTAVGQAVHTGCDLERVDIRAIEYRYIGAPSAVKAGRVSFALKNEGVEDHEMVLFKQAPGTTETLQQLLELPEDQAGDKLQFTGVTFGAPKTTNFVAVDLEPGTYHLVCFIPQGGGEDGPPHFMGGMSQTIVVS